MSTYKLLVKTITAENKQLDNGVISQEDYDAWKYDTLKKMDTFFVCGRITDEQYKELSDMLR